MKRTTDWTRKRLRETLSVGILHGTTHPRPRSAETMSSASNRRAFWIQVSIGANSALLQHAPDRVDVGAVFAGRSPDGR